MSHTARMRWLSGAIAVFTFAIGTYGVYQLGVKRGMSFANTPAERWRSAPTNVGDIDPATGQRVLYWHDPMVPGRRFDAPGKSPFMDMMLVPVYDDQNDNGGVTISPRLQQNLGMRTVEVARTRLTPKIEVAGNIAFNERDQALVQARAGGYVERLHVRATLDPVTKGQALIDLYVPEWVAAQEEFLAVRRMRGEEMASLVDAARQRMRQAGMSDEQILRMEQIGELQPRITLRAPIEGVLAELEAREGMTVMPGQTLFRINGISTVWANAEVPESQAALVRPGTTVAARSAASPTSVVQGSVQTILPSVDPDTRTIRARIELTNTERLLSPGMFVSLTLEGPSVDALVVPTEALIRTGQRTVVMVAEAAGAFRPVDVETGVEVNGSTEITEGLEPGQQVVVSGQFLIDSEASLRAVERRTTTTPLELDVQTEHAGEGTIEAIDEDSVTLSHAPIPSMQWGSMTMEFSLPAVDAASDLSTGDAVRFSFTMGDDGKPRIVRIEPAARNAQ